MEGKIFETVYKCAGGKVKCRKNDLTQSLETLQMNWNIIL
jgi:hypothetical protein